MQQKNLIFLSLLANEISNVSKRTKNPIFSGKNIKGNFILNKDKIEKLIKNRDPYRTVEEEFSIFMAKGAHTDIAKGISPRVDKTNILP